MTHDEIRTAWNTQADEDNQWDDLGEDEKIEWAASIAAAKERAARIRAQEEVVALKERITRAGVEQRRAVREAVPVNLDFGTLREIVNGLHRAWGDAQGYAYCPGSEPYIEARQRAMSMHAGALRYIESMESYTAPAHPAEGVPALAGTYAEARECEHCNHVGINDSAEGVATCVACQWIGDSPKEDKCPDCEAEGTMTASCPKCHHEYRLIADATLADPHPTQQGLEQFIEQVGDVHFQRCRIGSKDGKIRWDIEFGHYDAEVRGKTLREAITKAIAAQAKRGGEA